MRFEVEYIKKSINRVINEYEIKTIWDIFLSLFYFQTRKKINKWSNLFKKIKEKEIEKEIFKIKKEKNKIKIKKIKDIKYKNYSKKEKESVFKYIHFAGYMKNMMNWMTEKQWNEFLKNFDLKK